MFAMLPQSVPDLLLTPLLALLLAALLPAAAPAAPPPVHADGSAFGLPVAIEVRDLPADTARAAVAAALREVAVLERETDPESPAGPAKPIAGTLAALNAAAGRGPQPIEPHLFQVLSRAADFCLWSNGAHGPLARDLYRLWGRGAVAAALPADDKLAEAVKAAACGRLVLDPKAHAASLAAGGGIELWGFAEGAAVDRAVEVLRERGVGNAIVGIGRIWRAIGPGPDGKGWRVSLPALAGMPSPIGEVRLSDQSLAFVTADDRPLSIAGDIFSPLIDQRSGRPVDGMQAVAARTLGGLDAEALAAGLFILGTREGQLRVGALRPEPSVLWVLGSGAGSPLLVEYHWSATAPRKPDVDGSPRLVLPGH
jgi:thiamine biosynthesis lipoprotein ApbE